MSNLFNDQNLKSPHHPKVPFYLGTKPRMVEAKSGSCCNLPRWTPFGSPTTCHGLWNANGEQFGLPSTLCALKMMSRLELDDFSWRSAQSYGPKLSLVDQKKAFIKGSAPRFNEIRRFKFGKSQGTWHRPISQCFFCFFRPTSLTNRRICQVFCYEMFTTGHLIVESPRIQDMRHFAHQAGGETLDVGHVLGTTKQSIYCVLKVSRDPGSPPRKHVAKRLQRYESLPNRTVPFFCHVGVNHRSWLSWWLEILILLVSTVIGHPTSVPNPGVRTVSGTPNESRCCPNGRSPILVARGGPAVHCGLRTWRRRLTLDWPQRLRRF